MMPSLTLVRLGKWSEVLASPKPQDDWAYASLLDHFSRGMALVALGKKAEAQQELQQLRERLTDPILEKRRVPFNAPLPISRMAGYILEASLLFSQKAYDPALLALNQAITLEDQLIYTEPGDWPLPARQFLGAYLLQLKKWQEAEDVYREDLAHHPGNGWSLVGLHKALTLQGKRAELPQIEAGYRTAFSKAERIPTASVY